MKKVLVLTLALMMVLALAACGEKTAPSGGNGSGNGDTGKPVSGTLDSKYTYSYNPPTDNYYVVWQDFNADGSKNHEPETFACTQNGYSYATIDGVWHASVDRQKYYCRSVDSEWSVDPGYSYDDWKDDFSDGTNCGMFDDYFMYYFRAYGYDDDEGRLAEYYIGTEKIAGVNCMVFDSKGLNAVYAKFWIDPSNGCCIKYLDTESGEYSQVTSYNLDYKVWTDNLAPANYDGIE